MFTPYTISIPKQASRISFIAILFLCACIQSRAYDFKIRVVEELDSLDLQGVELKVLQGDSLVIAPTYTDGFGVAQVKDLPKGEYQLRLNLSGYNPLSALLQLDKDVDLGTIALANTNSTQLNEVVVQGARVTEDADKMTIVPLKRTIESSLNTLDVLRRMNLPGLRVNAINQTVSIYNSAPVFQVNGVKRSLAYVMGIDPSQIAKIEYANTPGVRYLQDGVGGVINIILKEQYQGGSLYTMGQSHLYHPQAYGMVDFKYNYKDSEFQVGISENYMNQTSYPSEQAYRETYISDDFRQTRDFTGRQHSVFNFLTANLGYQYHNRRGVSFNATLTFAKSYLMDKNRNELSIDEGAFFRQSAKSSIDELNPSLDLFFQKAWSGNRVLEINVNGKLTHSDNHNVTTESDLISPFYADNLINNRGKAIVGEVYWRQPLGIFTWQTSLRETYTHARNEYTLTEMKDEEHVNNSKTYLGTSFSHTGRTLSYSFGAGVSYNDYSCSSLTERSWQPTVFFNSAFAFGQFWRMNARVRYEPMLPTSGQRSGIDQPTTSILTIQGTPTLKAQHYTTLTVSPYFEIGNWSGGVDIYDSFMVHPIYGEIVYAGGGQFLNKMQNGKNYNLFKATLNLRYSGLFDHMAINFDGTYANFVYRVRNDKDVHNALNAKLQISAYWKNFYVEGYLNTPYKNLSYCRESKYTITYGLGVAYKLKNVRLTLQTQNLGFSKGNPSFTKIETQQNYTYYGHTSLPEYNNYISFGISYGLQFGRSYQSGNRKTYNTAEDDTILKIQ